MKLDRAEQQVWESRFIRGWTVKLEGIGLRAERQEGRSAVFYYDDTIFLQNDTGFFQNDWDFCKEIQELGIAILNPTNFCVSSQTVVSGIVFAYYGHFHFCLRKYLHHF